VGKNFAIIGVAGYVAPRHLKAIHETGSRLVAATDPHDSVGVLDRYAHDVRFFSEFERFDRHLEKLRRGPEEQRVHFVSVCSPNYLHDAHVRLALRVRADAICEKPLVINPWNLDQLQELERETGRRVFTVLQLRLHPALRALREAVAREDKDRVHDVELTYLTGRGPWYHVSWKGEAQKSGGLATNIGIHFFDVLLWLFGDVEDCELHVNEPTHMAGFLSLEKARVRWLLSVDRDEVPESEDAPGQSTYRSMRVDGEEIEFSTGFTDLHTRIYEDVLAGGGFGIEDARPSIELTHRIRHTELSVPGDHAHPRVLARRGSR
jgi:UDP-N-acetyl-2-amino-2-deoxyglucuronate dehydrogenase